MNGTAALITPRRLQAPRHDGEVLVDPPLADEPGWVWQNVARRQALEADVHGRPLSQLAAEARHGLLAAARRFTSRYRDLPTELTDTDGPVILVGHQPELVHPGVWFKNFVLSELASRTAAHAVHVICDNDAAPSPAIPVPSGSSARPTIASIPLDRPVRAMAHERRRVLDSELFRSFGDRAGRAIAPLVPHPLVTSWWPQAVAAARQTENLGLALAQARHQLEGQWGLRTLEVPLSRLCTLPAYHRFVAHLLSRARRFSRIHNELLGDYRRVNRVRSHSHPVPDLVDSNGWLETPFWVWTDADPTRRAAFVRSNGKDLQLTDRATLRERLEIGADGRLVDAEHQLSELAARGVSVRPRALMTTMFCRLLLGDVFIHGIGGAKYDELTDAIVRQFFGVEPLDYLVVSLTAVLPVDRPDATIEDIQRVDRLLRDLRFHPEHHVPRNGRTRPLIEEKAHLLSSFPPRGQRRHWHARMEAVNSTLFDCLQERCQQLQAERDQLVSAWRAGKILSSREYAFCLFPEDNLRQRLLDLSRQEP